MQPLSGNQRPLTSWHLWRTCLLYCPCHAKWIFADPLQTFHACHRFWNCNKTLTFCLVLARCRIHWACHEKWCLNAQKWSEMWCFYHVDFKICTFSTSHLSKTLYTRFDLEMLFTRQRRVIFDISSTQMALHLRSLTSKLPSNISCGLICSVYY